MFSDPYPRASANESSASQSDYSESREKLIRKRQQRAHIVGHMVPDTEEEDGDDDIELADQVDSDAGLPTTLRTTGASSSNNKGKERASLKSGPLLAEGKEEIRAFSTEVLEKAQDLADRLRISRKSVLISAGFGIRESRRENIANLHAQWYAATHTKPDGSVYFCASSLPF